MKGVIVFLILLAGIIINMATYTLDLDDTVRLIVTGVFLGMAMGVAIHR